MDRRGSRHGSDRFSGVQIMDRRSTLTEDLRSAVAHHELVAVYQPQVDLRTDRIVAAEALCRWQHPALGWVSPAEFIPIAEDVGLIHEIGHFMLEVSCRAAAGWNDLGIEVSVNVSPLQLETEEAFALLVSGLDGLSDCESTLTLEVTETQPILDLAPVAARLRKLQERGLGISIDDFGTGHSSLSQLTDLPASEVKIDQSLVQDVSSETTSTIAVVVRFAHSTGVRVVAEGVESDAQLARIKQLGCDRAQGFLIGRPVPEAEFRALVVA